MCLASGGHSESGLTHGRTGVIAGYGGVQVEARAPRFRRSIFAQTLAAILEAHGRNLDDLGRVPISLEGKRVARLASSLHNSANMPGLNQGEINSIVFGLRLTEDERLRIYAGLIALGTQRELLYYLPEDRAWQIAEQVRDSAYLWLIEQRHKGDDPTRRWRGTSTDGDSARAEAFSEALDAFDEAMRLQTLGEISSDGEIERLRLEQAQFYLDRSARQLDALAPSIRSTEEWAFWRQAVSRAEYDVRDQLE